MSYLPVYCIHKANLAAKVVSLQGIFHFPIYCVGPTQILGRDFLQSAKLTVSNYSLVIVGERNSIECTK